MRMERINLHIFLFRSDSWNMHMHLFTLDVESDPQFVKWEIGGWYNG